MEAGAAGGAGSRVRSDAAGARRGTGGDLQRLQLLDRWWVLREQGVGPQHLPGGNPGTDQVDVCFGGRSPSGGSWTTADRSPRQLRGPRVLRAEWHLHQRLLDASASVLVRAGAPTDGSQDEHTYNLVQSRGRGWYGESGRVGWSAGTTPPTRTTAQRRALVRVRRRGTSRCNEAFDTGLITVTRASSPAARSVTQPTAIGVERRVLCGGRCRVHCSGGQVTRRTSSSSSTAPGSRSLMAVHRTSPARSAAQGLRAPGTRSGNESVTFSASDNVGIRKAEIVDVTDAANPTVVASKDYNSGTLTAQKTRCDFTRPLPCPNLSGETLAANPPIAGHRTLLVRVTDSADNQTVSAPFAVYARGSANGANVTDTAKLTAGFPAKVYRRSKAGKRYYTYVLRPSRTVSYGKGGTLRGILRNADGQPITGADVRILVRENRTGAQYVDRGGLTTGRRRPRVARHPGRLLAHVSADLQGVRRRRQSRRALEGDAQHARAHHRARLRVTSAAVARRASAARSSAARAATRCHARAPGLPATPRMADGRHGPYGQGRSLFACATGSTPGAAASASACACGRTMRIRTRAAAAGAAARARGVECSCRGRTSRCTYNRYMGACGLSRTCLSSARPRGCVPTGATRARTRSLGAGPAWSPRFERGRTSPSGDDCVMTDSITYYSRGQASSRDSVSPIHRRTRSPPAITPWLALRRPCRPPRYGVTLAWSGRGAESDGRFSRRR